MPSALPKVAMWGRSSSPGLISGVSFASGSCLSRLLVVCQLQSFVIKGPERSHDDVCTSHHCHSLCRLLPVCLQSCQACGCFCASVPAMLTHCHREASCSMRCTPRDQISQLRLAISSAHSRRPLASCLCPHRSVMPWSIKQKQGCITESP